MEYRYDIYLNTAANDVWVKVGDILLLINLNETVNFAEVIGFEKMGCIITNTEINIPESEV